jgi:hypothetical protein
VLLSGILLAVVVLAVIIGVKGSGGPSPDTTKGHPSKPIESGQTETRDQATAQGLTPSSPSRAADTGRIREAYQPGKTYRTLVKVNLASRASAKDWGITQDMNLLYIAEAETLRTIESNDGQKMTILLEFRRAKNLSVHTQVEGIRFDLGGKETLALAAGDWLGSTIGLPLGWTAVTLETAGNLLNSQPAKEIMSRIATDQSTKLFSFVSALQGKKVRVEYVNGKGVVAIAPIGCSLSGDQTGLIYASALASDVYLLPDLQSKPGDQWRVEGSDMLPVVDPSLHATMSGQITVTRKADEGSSADRRAVIEVERGTLDLHDSDDRSESVGRWTPQGRMEFSFRDKTVTGAELTGQLVVEKRSTDHILFEARHTIQPKYNVTYFCEILK